MVVVVDVKLRIHGFDFSSEFTGAFSNLKEKSIICVDMKDIRR